MSAKHTPNGPIELHDEIDRLKAINAELLEALNQCVEHLEWSTPQGQLARSQARYLIYKHKGEGQ